MSWRRAAFAAGLAAREIRELESPRTLERPEPGQGRSAGVQEAATAQAPSVNTVLVDAALVEPAAEVATADAAPVEAPPAETRPAGELPDETPEDGAEPDALAPEPAPSARDDTDTGGPRPFGRQWWYLRALPVTAILVIAAYVRFEQLASVGLNSDEAVYTGSAEALAGNHTLGAMFPVFRAHPILVQLLVGQALGFSDTDWSARAVPAAFGVATVAVTYLLGARLYKAPAGMAAAALLAVMPYHVVVSRQVLLDGPMTCFAILGLYCVARAAEADPKRWAAAAGAALGLSALSKETAVVLLAGVYAFGAMGSAGRLRLKHHTLGLGVFAAVFVTYPVAVSFAASGTGQNFLLWQLLRRANHPLWFYFTDLPGVIGPIVLLLAATGLVWRWPRRGWRERLLLTWIAVPLVFFTIWPVKGFQYLLPAAPALAVLAGRTLGELWARAHTASGDARPWPWPLPALRAGALLCTAAAAATLAIPTWERITPSSSTAFLAGTGGLPGGRETGQWIAAHTPGGARLLAAGPSIANVLEFYGHHQVGALSVSTDPRNRNPVYQPVGNPDRAVRTGQYQYLVWDSFTADRSPYYAAEIRKLIDKYHGVAAYTATVAVGTGHGPGAAPVIIVYEVHP